MADCARGLERRSDKQIHRKPKELKSVYYISNNILHVNYPDSCIKTFEQYVYKFTIHNDFQMRQILTKRASNVAVSLLFIVFYSCNILIIYLYSN